jgi:hypothetical protein
LEGCTDYTTEHGEGTTNPSNANIDIQPEVRAWAQVHHGYKQQSDHIKLNIHKFLDMKGCRNMTDQLQPQQPSSQI